MIRLDNQIDKRIGSSGAELGRLGECDALHSWRSIAANSSRAFPTAKIAPSSRRNDGRAQTDINIIFYFVNVAAIPQNIWNGSEHFALESIGETFVDVLTIFHLKPARCDF